MAVSVRLTRAGAKKAPFYHIVALEKRSRRDGAYIEMLGSYDPKTNPPTIKIDQQKMDYWIKVGAQLSDTVAGLVKRSKAATPAT
jgi:small subunit ribosomal protein S16